VADLRRCWLAMHTEDVHRLSNELPPMVRPVLRFLLRSVLTSKAHGGDSTINLPADEQNMSAGGFLEKMSALFKLRSFKSLLDTTPWRHTLSQWMDFERINAPDGPALLLTATDIQRGTLRLFCNRERAGRPRDTISIEHLMASSSIPAVYPWTEIDGARYWDGAVLANTPLNAVIELAGTEEVDILVVMMTPWIADPEDEAAPRCDPPGDLIQALALTIDWTLLGSYRTALRMIERYNRLVEAAEKLDRAAAQTGDETLRLSGPTLRRVSMPRVIAPQNFMPLEWMVDYEAETHEQLFAMGRADAERVLVGRDQMV
jgi:NTE family protein